jgi:hypothetical protein
MGGCCNDLHTRNQAALMEFKSASSALRDRA